MAWYKFDFNKLASITKNCNIIWTYAKGKTRSQIEKNQTTATAAKMSAIDDHFPQFDKYYTQTNNVCYAMFANTNKAFLDLTGRFPYKASRRNEYILIVYHYDFNAILGLPLKIDKQVLSQKPGWSYK